MNKFYKNPDEICKNCIFFRSAEALEDGGECRRHSAANFLTNAIGGGNGNHVTMWPIVLDTDWCGDWRRGWIQHIGE